MTSAEHLIAPEEIMALLDGELTPERASSVSTHIESCAACRDTANSLRNVSQLLSKWDVAVNPVNPERDDAILAEASYTSSDHHAAGVPRVTAFFRQHWLVSSLSVALMVMMLRGSSALYRANFSSNSWGRAEKQTRTVVNLGSPAPSKAPEGIVSGTGDAVAGLQTPQSDSPVDYARAEDSPTNEVPAFVPSGPMIARTVSVVIVAKDFAASRAALESILAHHHGYAASLTASTQANSARSLQASLRIPAAELTAAIVELKALGHVQNETQNGEEVTQQHADLVARLKNSRETEHRLQAILQQRTGKISDVLEVEQEIARVRGEIEQMEAEQKGLEHRVAFASVDLTLAEEYKAQIGSPSPAIATRIHNAMVKGYRDAAETLIGIVIFFAEYGPSLLIWFAVLVPVGWFLLRRWLRARYVASSVGA
jgi:hypothetical protein